MKNSPIWINILLLLPYVIFSEVSFLGYLRRIENGRSLFSIASIVLLLVVLAFDYIIKKDRKDKNSLHTIALVIVAVNIFVQLNGGLSSHFSPVYFLVVLYLALGHNFWWGIFAALTISFLELGSGVFSEHQIWPLWITTSIFLIVIPLVPVIVQNRWISKPRNGTVSGKDIGFGLPERSSSSGRSSSRDDLYLQIVRLIMEITGAHTAALFLYDEIKSTLRIRAAESKSLLLDLKADIPVGKGIIGWIGKEKKRLTWEDFSGSENALGYYSDKEHVGSFAGVPIMEEEEKKSLGVLVVDFKGPRLPTDCSDLLEHFSRLLKTIIKQEHALEEHRTEAAFFSLISEFSEKLNARLYEREVEELVINTCYRIFGPDRLVLCSYGTESGYVQRVLGSPKGLHQDMAFSLKAGVVGWVAKQNKPLLLPELTRGDRPIPRFGISGESTDQMSSFLAVPLRVEGGYTALLSMESEKTNYFSEYDLNMLLAIVGESTIALAKARLFEKMEQLATIDGLTDLANHRSFQETLTKEISRAKRYKLSLSLILVDIDHFKKVNDTYGHLAGDEVLRHIAKLLKSSVREGDMVARYGGEEFACIILESGGSFAEMTAERIRSSTENKAMKIEGNELRVTLSLGVASFPENGSTPAEVVGTADKALYEAKANGRNQVMRAKLRVAIKSD